MRSRKFKRLVRPPFFDRRLFWTLAAAYFAGFLIFSPRPGRLRLGARPLVLAPTQTAFFHDQFAEWTLRAPSARAASLLKKFELEAWVERDGRPVVTVGETLRVAMPYDAALQAWRGRWPVPWNAPDGQYQVRVDTAAWPADLPPLAAKPFHVARRAVAPLPAGFAALTLEGFRSLAGIPGPDGLRSIGGMPAWAEFIGADALFVAGGESNGFDGKLSEEFPWRLQSFKGLQDLGRECRRRGLKLGAYVLCFMVGGPAENVPDYKYGWHFDKGRIVYGLDLPRFRGASIMDRKRPQDIVEALRRLQALEGVDWLGLDYIRPAFGGNELVEDFAREMPGVELPPGWKSLSPKERMLWVAKGRWLSESNVGKGDPHSILTEQWFWYRAHRTAQVIRTILGGLGDRKPAWAFTLSWQKGWEHGQDPVMFRDAGLDADAVMLYECDRAMFDGFVRQWGRYARADQLNILVGNTFDWPLHQRTLRPSGPEEFMDRSLTAARGFHSDGRPARGMFFHDIHRALVGRKGPYGTEEWMLAAGAAVTGLRAMHGVLPYEVALDAPRTVAEGETRVGTVTLIGHGARNPVEARLFAAPDVEVRPQVLVLSQENPSAEFTLTWRPGAGSAARGNRSFVAVRAERPDAIGERCQIQLLYFDGRRKTERAASKFN